MPKPDISLGRGINLLSSRLPTLDILQMKRACSTSMSAKISFSKVVFPVPGGPFTLLILFLSFNIRLTATCCIRDKANSGFEGNRPSG